MYSTNSTSKTTRTMRTTAALAWGIVTVLELWPCYWTRNLRDKEKTIEVSLLKFPINWQPNKEEYLWRQRIMSQTWQ